ncbi:putative esterase [Saonia flava]|uniref:Putative esterase n=1 Tax=Saonia flava TaxID=523696 RepID=A0A846QTH0_9FLAO|nr:esterase [Saonia flava]NJB69643.1 putative esterase [Saonia flava]
METSEKQITYTSTNSYSYLNGLSEKTKNVWLVFHGIGYLSRYFLKYFNELPSEENYIIAPQAPSKYYLNNQYKHVGASWLTKESTVQEMENLHGYINAVFKAEKIPPHCNLIVFGFSQGVSIASRWVAKNKIECNQLILYAGGIPNELTSSDFDFLEEKTSVTVIMGDKDEYLTEERLRTEKQKIEILFKGKAKQITFDGGHEVKKEIVNSLVK